MKLFPSQSSLEKNKGKIVFYIFKAIERLGTYNIIAALD